ncbi:MAG: hypothetical protein AB7O43_20935, partial [Hyphomicrobiaceae bacterium]
MKFPTRNTDPKAPRARGVLAVSLAAMLAGACSAGGELGSLGGLAPGASIATASTPKGAAAGNPAQSQSDLEKAIEYGGVVHKMYPADLKAG